MGDRSVRFVIIMVMACLGAVAGYMTYAAYCKARSKQPAPNLVKSECILSTDSSGCKVFRIESDGYVLFANNQGGLVAINSQAVYPTTNSAYDLGSATNPWLTAYVRTNGFIELRRGRMHDEGRGE